MKKFILGAAALLAAVSVSAADTDIRLNSVGYRVNSVKKASIKTGSAAEFHVKSAPNGPYVLTGTASTAVYNTDTGENLRIADFSAVTSPGSYFLVVDGVGASFIFTINNDVYLPVFYTVFRGFYLWRCGTAVSGTHSYGGTTNTYAHTACHVNDAYMDVVGGGHVIQNGTGGWHDAGDYNKYVTNANVTFGVLGKAWEYFRTNIEPLALDLPETAPGYPEFLRELKFETDWLLKMQAADGGVYNKVSTPGYGAFIMPQNEFTARYYALTCTAATADFAAMMAQASRIFAPYDAAYAGQCLDAARVSYACLTTYPDDMQANNSGFSTSAYQTGDPDDRMWAAAEMWETTGEGMFLADFESRAGAYSSKISWSMDWGNVQNLAMITYYMSSRPGKNTAILNDIISDTIATANGYIGNAGSHGYARLLASSYWWGVNGAVVRVSHTLYAAYRMTGDTAYFDAANEALNHMFGRNYYCRSMVTGVGHNAPLRPHDRRSGADGIVNPWPGYLVGGPDNGATSWVDSQDSANTNEVAINWNAAMTFALAWLMKDPYVPTPTITGTPPTETVTPTITETHTITQTHTITETHTISPTVTVTYTATVTPTEIFSTLEIKDHFTYPNPSKGAPIIFRFHNNGYIETMKIKIFTISDRKVGEVEKGPINSGPMNEVEWNPPDKLGNGMYIYVIEARGKNTPVVKKQGGFVILQHLQ